MTRTLMSRSAILRAAAAAAAVLVLALPQAALAQAENIEFEVGIFRVDLVQNDEGEVTERFVEVNEAVPGEEIEYRVTAVNEGDVIYRPGTVVVTLPIGDGVAYVEGSAGPTDDEQILVEFSADEGATFEEPPVLVEEDGERTAVDPEDYDQIRWTFSKPFEPGQEETLYYRVQVR